MNTKLKQILEYPVGMPLFFSYLKKQGYSSQHIQKYIQNNWLDKVAAGVYKRSGVELSIELVLKAIQQQTPFLVYPSAQTALYYQGIVHYAKLGEEPIIVVIPPPNNLPKWIRQNKNFKFIEKKIFLTDFIDSYIKKDEIILASRERALMEMCALIPKNANFDELVHLMELVPSLRPGLLQNLLEQCVSVKVKRLFLYVAELIGHNWFNKLDLSKIDLGKGTRQIVKNGKYIKKYDICIPKISNE